MHNELNSFNFFGAKMRCHNDLEQISELYIQGIGIFQNNENFLKWMKLPITALGGMEPQELAEIPGGVSKIKDVLGRIEHGVYS